MTTVQTGFADINGAKIYYEVAGNGHPFIMVHAGIANNAMWDDQFAFFANQYKVVRFDMRGFGQTAPVAGDFQRHEDIRALLDFLDIESAYIMGCSMGGGASMNFALDYPDRSDALIMVGSGPGGFEFEESPPPQWDGIVAEFKAGNLERVSELETQVWVDGRGRSPDQVNPVVRKKVFDMNLIALKNEKLGLGKEVEVSTPAAKRLSELHLPVLVVVGDLDSAYINAAADFMAANISGARKIVINGTAHVPNMEFPNEFNTHVQEFLSKLLA